jgi:hypothetical protein
MKEHNKVLDVDSGLTLGPTVNKTQVIDGPNDLNIKSSTNQISFLVTLL